MLKSKIISVFIGTYLKRVPATGQRMEPAELLLSKHQHTHRNRAKQPPAEGSTGEAELQLCHQTRKWFPHADRNSHTYCKGTVNWASQHHSECSSVWAQRLFTDLHPIRLPQAKREGKFCRGALISFRQLCFNTDDSIDLLQLISVQHIVPLTKQEMFRPSRKLTEEKFQGWSVSTKGTSTEYQGAL